MNLIARSWHRMLSVSREISRAGGKGHPGTWRRPNSPPRKAESRRPVPEGGRGRSRRHRTSRTSTGSAGVLLVGSGHHPLGRCPPHTTRTTRLQQTSGTDGRGLVTSLGGSDRRTEPRRRASSGSLPRIRERPMRSRTFRCSTSIHGTAHVGRSHRFGWTDEIVSAPPRSSGIGRNPRPSVRRPEQWRRPVWARPEPTDAATALCDRIAATEYPCG